MNYRSKTMSKVNDIIESLNEKVDLNKVPKKNKNGNCYESALHLMMDFYQKGLKDIKLVHGIVTGQGALEGIEYGHAWVELNSMVFDSSNGRDLVLPKKQYYDIGKIKITRKYNYDDMLKMMDKYGTYGPWDKVFKNYP